MAAFNFNKVILGGRLTANPEVKMTPSGTAVVNFSVAVNRRAKDQPADFITCTAFKEKAELIGKFFSKGSSICVVGEIQTRSWTDNNGSKRFATEVLVNEVFFVDSKSDGESAGNATYVPDTYAQTSPKFEEISTDGDLPF